MFSKVPGDTAAEQLAVAFLHGVRQECWGLKQHGTHTHQLKILFPTLLLSLPCKGAAEGCSSGRLPPKPTLGPMKLTADMI